ncbi:MAG TPA: hypothetical protein VFR47_32380, partial [Anaerolineales bacterium]|nr:hypothetical protein [Anaerolineales bacterium]
QAPAGTEPPAQTQTEAPAQGECPPSDPPPFNPDKMVSFVLPSLALPDSGANGVILQVTPRAEPPTESQEELLTGECGVVIGSLTAVRDLRLSDQQELKEGTEYQVKVQQGLMHFVTRDGEELVTSIKADLRTLSRQVSPPEAFITIKDICYSWNQVQVCTEPSPSLAIPDEQNRIQEAMQAAVDTLERKGYLKASDINVAGAIPDMVGPQAQEMQQASLIAAPTVNFPSGSGKEEPDNGALLGVVNVVLPIEQDGVVLSEGPYAVFAQRDPSNAEQWQGLFVSQDGAQTVVPAKYLEVRGEIERDGPMAIVIDIRICLCFFEC